MRSNSLSHWSETFSRKATAWTGTSWAFLLSVTIVVIWLVSGPFFHYSDTWQLVINTATTIVTFLMVFLIQRTQNKDSLAVQVKLNEILAALEGASNRLINIEDMTEEDVTDLHRRYQALAAKACDQGDLRAAHSIEEQEPAAPSGEVSVPVGIGAGSGPSL